MIFMSVKTYQKGGIIIPIEDFIMSLFNLKPAQICQLEIKRENNDTINAYIISHTYYYYFSNRDFR